MVRSAAIGEVNQLAVELAPGAGHSVRPLAGTLARHLRLTKEPANTMLQRFAYPGRARVQQRMCQIWADPSSVDHNIVGIVNMQRTGVP